MDGHTGDGGVPPGELSRVQEIGELALPVADPGAEGAGGEMLDGFEVREDNPAVGVAPEG